MSVCSTLDNLLKGKLISEDEAAELCLRAREIFLRQKNVIHVAAPVTVRRAFTCYVSSFCCAGVR